LAQVRSRFGSRLVIIARWRLVETQIVVRSAIAPTRMCFPVSVESGSQDEVPLTPELLCKTKTPDDLLFPMSLTPSIVSEVSGCQDEVPLTPVLLCKTKTPDELLFPMSLTPSISTLGADSDQEETQAQQQEQEQQPQHEQQHIQQQQKQQRQAQLQLLTQHIVQLLQLQQLVQLPQSKSGRSRQRRANAKHRTKQMICDLLAAM